MAVFGGPRKEGYAQLLRQPAMNSRSNDGICQSTRRCYLDDPLIGEKIDVGSVTHAAWKKEPRAIMAPSCNSRHLKCAGCRVAIV